MSRALDFSSVAASCIHFAFLCARVHVTVVTTFQLNKFIEYKSFRLSSSNRFNFCYYIRNMTTITATKDKTDVDKLKLFQLKDASHYTRWKNRLQDHMFRKIRNNNMDQLTTADTLDEDFFKKLDRDDGPFMYSPTEESKSTRTYKEASDATDKRPMTDPEFLEKCKEHAFATGRGFHEWLYVLYADVRAALSDDIQEQTAGVAQGDLVTLLKTIKLALHHFELHNPDELEIEYSKCTMEREGKQDLIKFLADRAHQLHAQTRGRRRACSRW